MTLKLGIAPFDNLVQLNLYLISNARSFSNASATNRQRAGNAEALFDLIIRSIID